MNTSSGSGAARFRQLHEAGCFVLPNPWDKGTARFLEEIGFVALATTSAGFAFCRAQPDGGVSRDEMLAHIAEIVEATPLPVNADFMNGYADAPEEVQANVARCLTTGVAGLSIEDSTGQEAAPLYEEKLAADRIAAARRAIDDADKRVVLTGRCEAFLVDHPDPMPVVLKRLAAYAAAGADCLYAPGVTKADEIAAIIKEVAPKPVNVLVSGFNSHLTLPQLRDLGVRRVSVGSGLALVAWQAFLNAARDIHKTGSFVSLGKAAPSAALNGLFGEAT